jgi:hypothetical protein
LVTKEWERFLPLTFYYDHLHEDDIAEINVKIYDFYFKEKFMDHEDITPLTNVRNHFNTHGVMHKVCRKKTFVESTFNLEE